jgi:outer membrane protein OmpA-like peptidoglycan-associated protein
MWRKTLLVTVGLVLSAGSVYAADGGSTSKQEAMGVGAGAVVGAAAGGPVGFLLGAALGGWLGDRFHQQQETGADLERRWSSASERVTTLEQELGRTRRGLARAQLARQEDQLAMTRTLEQAINMQVLFKTGLSELDDVAETRITRLAALLADMDGIAIEVAGHADGRGGKDYNAQLSAARAAVVRDALIRAGIESERITTTALGEAESVAGEGDLDGYALERRADIRLLLTPASQVAQQH